MFYKPKFCAECGEKVERIQWQPWTSRRFCEDCAERFENPIRWKTGIAAVTILVAGIFAGQIGRFTQKPVAVANAQALAANFSTTPQSNQPAKIVNQPLSAQTNSVVQTPPQIKPVINPPPVVAAQGEVAYYCGAKTQKGTLCTRRVKGGGRCWQHVGKPPMVAQERLLIQTGNR